jgi:hypothetical protein
MNLVEVILVIGCGKVYGFAICTECGSAIRFKDYPSLLKINSKEKRGISFSVCLNKRKDEILQNIRTNIRKTIDFTLVL